MNREIQVSKKLSLHLRHAPEAIGITLGAGGWVPVADLLAALDAHGFRVDAAGMVDAGHEFRVSANGVWLAEVVPAAYLSRAES